MPSMQEVRRALARIDQKAVLRKLTDEALALQEVKPVLDPDTTQEEIKTRVKEQETQILGDAEADYANYETNRTLAESELGRSDYVAWGICGITVGSVADASRSPISRLSDDPKILSASRYVSPSLTHLC